MSPTFGLSMDGNWMPVYGKTAEEVQVEAWAKFKQRADEDVSRYPLADLGSERFVNHLAALTIETGKG